MKKVLPLVLIIIGTALLVTAVVLWISSNTSTAPQSFGLSVTDWITLIAGITGLGASIKGWKDLFKKEKLAMPFQSNTDGGIIISGTVDSIGKDVIGRDQHITTNIVSEDYPYNVEGLSNPYLGLQAFTYNERDRYVGREKLTEEALQLIVSSEESSNLLFITGASGSGKSSFVQASLLPAIVDFYKKQDYKTYYSIFRPSGNPKKRLNDSLRQLGRKEIQVIVIDQFEEIFTQSIPRERDLIVKYLSKISPFNKSRRIFIIVVRSDYLGEIFGIPDLWKKAKQAVPLRTMKEKEIKDAIQHPLRTRFPDGKKRFEPALVEKLARDASESDTYLPLLQVTLEEIWNKGQLKLSAYSTLTDAIKERANTVLSYYDFDNASPCNSRAPEEQSTLIEVLLDLVNVSMTDDIKHDVRISRKLEYFSPERLELIYELSKARLVSINKEENTEVVNLIHETLIRNWDFLHKKIKEQRNQLQKRARFETQLRLWISDDGGDRYLLSSTQISEASELQQATDISLQSPQAQAFLQKSKWKLEITTRQDRMQGVGTALLRSTTMNSDTFLDIVLTTSIDITNSGGGILYALNRESGEIVVCARDSLAFENTGDHLGSDDKAVGKAINSLEIVVISEADTNKTIVVTPLKVEDRAFGALKLIRDKPSITAEEQKLLSEFVAKIAKKLEPHMHAAISSRQSAKESSTKTEFDQAELYQRLIGSMAHELRTPLTAIMGHVDILDSVRFDEEALWRRSLGFVAGETERMAHLVEDFLSLSRLDRISLNLKPINLRMVVEEAISSLYESAEQRKVILLLQVPSTLPRVLADPDRIRQVFFNLLYNAIKYAPGCELTVRLTPTEGFVRVEVSDNGHGISQEDLPYIFEPFRRGKQTTPGTKGTGLGLTIVRAILNQHQSPISVRSESGSGTTFTFSLTTSRSSGLEPSNPSTS